MESKHMQTTPHHLWVCKGYVPVTPQASLTTFMQQFESIGSHQMQVIKTPHTASSLGKKKTKPGASSCTTAHGSYPPLSSISLAVIGCVLKRSLVLRPPPGPPGRYRRGRRRPPSEPGATARSREDAAARPASGQLVSTQTEQEEGGEEVC